jgi:two-component system cell cycle sensor histidine kinase/response regulator CckA
MMAQPVRTGRPRVTKTILLVDDEPEVRRILQRMLAAQGFTVLAAEDGPSALDLFARHPDPIHLLITDVEMPDMNGRALARQLRAKAPDLPVLFMSGNMEDELADGVVPDPKECFLQKPCTRNELLAGIAALAGAPPES